MAELRHAVRNLLRAPGFALAAIGTLALGIGATTTIFSVVYGVLLRPLPYRDPGALVVIQAEKNFPSGVRMMNFSGPELEDVVANLHAFETVAISGGFGLTLKSDAGVESISGSIVSGRFFDAFGLPLILGRAIGDEPDPVVVISHRFWQRVFGGSADVIGRSITFADRNHVETAYTVVGVAAPEFHYPSARTDFWRPLEFVRAINEGSVRNVNGGGFSFVGRLRPGATRAQALDDAERAVAAIAGHFDDGRRGMRPKVLSLEDVARGTVGQALLVLLGAVGLVLLVACANVANLILARQSSRAREVAVRLALGAPRKRLISYLLAEAGMIAAAGAAVGVLVAVGCIDLLKLLEPAQLPRLDAIGVDTPVLLFASAMAVGASLLSGAIPAVVTTRSDAALAVRRTIGSEPGRRGARRLRSILIVTEVAISIVLLVGAALLARTFDRLVGTDLGVTAENVIVAHLDLTLGRPLPESRHIEIGEALEQRLSDLPTIRSVGFGTGLPPSGEFMRVSFNLVNAANPQGASHMVTVVPASPGYFPTLQVRLLRGRLFTAHDTPLSAPVVILNREAARRFFGDAEPIGQTLPIGATPEIRKRTPAVVIGVVENVKYTGLTASAESVIYRPFGQNPFRMMFLVARTDGDPAAAVGQVRQMVREFDRDISIVSVQPLTTFVSQAAALPRFRALLLSAIAGIALLLAAIGLYSVLAYSVFQRTTEIGVRVALGASGRDVLRLIVGEGLRLVAIGTVLGLAGAFAATRALASLLYGVTATDATSFVLSAGGLLVVALLACYLPARRAARIDPIAALRTE